MIINKISKINPTISPTQGAIGVNSDFLELTDEDLEIVAGGVIKRSGSQAFEKRIYKACAWSHYDAQTQDITDLSISRFRHFSTIVDSHLKCDKDMERLGYSYRGQIVPIQKGIYTLKVFEEGRP